MDPECPYCQVIVCEHGREFYYINWIILTSHTYLESMDL